MKQQIGPYEKWLRKNHPKLFKQPRRKRSNHGRKHDMFTEAGTANQMLRRKWGMK